MKAFAGRTPVGPAEDLPPAAVGLRGHHLRRVGALALVLLVIGVDIAFVAPHVSGSAADLGHLRWGWVAAAVGAELASLATYARLRRSLLRLGGVHMSLRRMGALTLASTAISTTVPAGSAVSAGYLYRQFRRAGGSAPLAAWTLSAAAVVSGLAFTVLTMAGTVLDDDSSIAAFVGAGALSLVAVLALVALLAAVTRHPGPWVHAVYGVLRRLPLVGRRYAGDADAEQRLVAQLGAITPRARDWAIAFCFAIVNWVADLACFVFCCHAVGVHRLGLGVAVVAYVAGLATIGISLLPAGLGSVEAGMLFGLTHAGVAAPMAVAGILTYRVVAYGLFAAVGWVAWLVLRPRPPDTSATHA